MTNPRSRPAVPAKDGIGIVSALKSVYPYTYRCHPWHRATPTMPIPSLAGTAESRKGFTLIEVLIVMVIISIVGGIAILTITRNQNTRLETLAKQLVSLITLAEEQAMLQPAVLGLAIAEHRFQFYQYHDAAPKQRATWEPLTDTALGLHSLPNDISITIHMQNEIIPPITDDRVNNPQIIISSSGDITPFTLLIGKKDDAPRYRITGEANGSVKETPL